MINSNEMARIFYHRQDTHIKLFNKYCSMLVTPEKVLEMNHDDSKYEEPELSPYIRLAWNYHCDRNFMARKFATPEEQEEMDDATEHHIRTNEHHPEFWAPERSEGFIVRGGNRDSPNVYKPADASKMSNEAMVQMVADWCAVSEEFKTSPYDWANKVIGVRYLFTPEQIDFIFEVLQVMWPKEEN